MSKLLSPVIFTLTDGFVCVSQSNTCMPNAGEIPLAMPVKHKHGPSPSPCPHIGRLQLLEAETVRQWVSVLPLFLEIALKWALHTVRKPK